MKKTSKSPENTEITPNKKKLKQARLPFMLLSDVSPKTETPPSRKRKLSVPDAEPATKVGKLCKENSITEELVVISDEDSKGFPSPKKQDKLPNPYVKLVDAARKKKLQKSKGQKKAKSKSTKKLTCDTSENQAKTDNVDNNGIEDVEMIEVEAVVHQDGNANSEKSVNNVLNGDLVDQKDKETVKKSKNRKSTPKKISPKQSPKNRQKSNAENSKDITTVISETISLDDSNNSTEVTMKIPTSSEKDTIDESETSSNQKDSKESPEARRASKRNQQKKNESPKKSSLNRVTKGSEDNTKQSDNSSNEEETDNSSKKEESNNSSEKEVKQIEQEEDSDIEMVDLETQSIEKSQEDNNSVKSTEEPVTPKRSSRNKTKSSEINLDVSTCSMLNESLSSNPCTPKQDKSLNESIKNLTPKQMAKRLESAKKREEKEKEKMEREKKRQQEKEERAKQRQEKEDQKKKEREEKEEAKKKEREEKEEQKRKEKEEKEKQRELEKKVREEKEEAKKKEKEEKEEQRKKEKEAREEERRKKQEALELEKQEQELKLKKTKEAFVSFFVPKQKMEKESSSEKAPVSKNNMLSSFTIKVDMRLAPTCRAELDTKRKDALDKSIKEQESLNYLTSLKDGRTKPGWCGRTWPLEEKDDDVLIVEDELPLMEEAGSALACESAPREKLRPKLLSFHENRRPPYWGTWRKKSAFVRPRRPFGQEKQLDYEVDSDDDWEDEADGESLDGSAGGSEDEAGNDDYEVDNEVFVPHGYLSDEEATMDEEDDNVLSLSPETQKVRLKHLEDEFESELKKPTEKLKPRLYGPLWETSEGQKPENCIDALWNYFQKFAMIMDDVTPFLQPAPEPEKETEKKKIKKKKVVAEGDANEQSPKNKRKKEAKAENKEGKKPKQEAKKSLPNQPGASEEQKTIARGDARQNSLVRADLPPERNCVV